MKKSWYTTLLFFSISSLLGNFRGAKTSFLHRRDDQGTTIINRPTLPYIISSPGNYKIISPLALDATVSTTLISIQSNDVKINFNGKRLAQALPSTKNVTGIHVADGFSNISIENGNINNITGTGIIVGQNCFNIGIQNMIIVETGSGGIEIQPGADTVSIHNCFIGKSLTVGKNNTGISLDTNKNISISQSSLFGIRAPSGYNAYNLYASNSHYCFVMDSSFNGAAGDTAMGIYLDDCHDFRFSNNEASGNVASNGSGRGIHLNDCRGNCFETIIASQNKGSTRACGIELAGASQYNKFNNTTTSHQQATSTGSAYGIYAVAGEGNYFSSITALGNTGGSSSSSEGAGIKFNSVIANTIENSNCSYNNGNAGNGYGIFLDDVTKCVIESNKMYYNKGTVAGYGIKESTSSSSFIASNQCFGNSNNYSLTIITLNAIQTVDNIAPRSIQTANKGNINITT